MTDIVAGDKAPAEAPSANGANQIQAPPNVMLQWAEHYAGIGWSVFPARVNGNTPGLSSKYGGRGHLDATCDLNTVREWWGNRSWNIGVRTGSEGAGVFVLDVDVGAGKVGDQTLADLEATHGKLPETLTARTPKGGLHIYFQHPVETDIRNSTSGIGKHLDIRANGGYATVPPSVRPEGSYQWINPETPIAEAPAWLIEAAREANSKTASKKPGRPKGKQIKPPAGPQDLGPPEPADGTVVQINPGNVPEGIRNAYAFKEACSLRARDVDRATAEGTILHLARNVCNPPLDDAEALRTVASAYDRYQPNIECSDRGAAALFVHHYGTYLRWVPAWGDWLAWNGWRWQPDKQGIALSCAKELVEFVRAERQAVEPDSPRAKELKGFQKHIASLKGIKAALELAQPDLFLDHTLLDADPWLLGVQNGTVDLRTGQLREPNPDDYITKSCAVPYDPQATCQLWEETVKQSQGGVDEMVGYLQRAFGYTAAGDGSEQCLLFAEGEGANAKSTVVETGADIFGDYATQLPAESLMVRHNGSNGVPSDVAALEGSRMVVTTELEDGQRLRENQVKALTGGDKIRARYLYKEWYSFNATFTIWMVGNHRPGIRGTDHAIWRRIRRLEFKQRFEGDAKDPHRREGLRPEWPGILAWIVRGCLAWQQHGLAPPQSVLASTEAYRIEQDQLGRFIDEKCVLEEGSSCGASDLYQSYKGWCLFTGEHHVKSQTKFGRALSGKGFQKTKDRSGWSYSGVKLAKEMQPGVGDQSTEEDS